MHRVRTRETADDRPWWWNPPGIDDGEWARWLQATKEIEPDARAHRLASSAAIRLFAGTRLVEVRCREHGSLVADVRMTPRGPLWRSPVSGVPRKTLPEHADLLDLGPSEAELVAWCEEHGEGIGVPRDRVVEAIETARSCGYVVLEV